MNTMFRKMSLCVLLLAIAGGVTARSDRQRDDQPPERTSQRYEAQRDNSRNQQSQNERANKEAAQNAPRARLSPDERRALRQQINEVGRDLYPPRR
ncbi:hypothetical protein ACVBEF_02065 [Glaciimonas sp. GG7]